MNSGIWATFGQCLTITWRNFGRAQWNLMDNFETFHEHLFWRLYGGNTVCEYIIIIDPVIVDSLDFWRQAIVTFSQIRSKCTVWNSKLILMKKDHMGATTRSFLSKGRHPSYTPISLSAKMYSRQISRSLKVTKFEFINNRDYRKFEVDRPGRSLSGETPNLVALRLDEFLIVNCYIAQSDLLRLPWIFPGAPLTFNASGNIQGGQHWQVCPMPMGCRPETLRRSDAYMRQ